MSFPGNLGDMLQQAQQMQEKMEEIKTEAEKREVEASSGGGMVTVKVNGKGEVTALRIEKTVVDPNDVDMLQDLVQAAVNEGVRRSRDILKEEMAKLTGGLNIPGFKFPF